MRLATGVGVQSGCEAVTTGIQSGRGCGGSWRGWLGSGAMGVVSHLRAKPQGIREVLRHHVYASAGVNGWRSVCMYTITVHATLRASIS